MKLTKKLKSTLLIGLCVVTLAALVISIVALGGSINLLK